jgi:hypothetical protein
MKPSYAADAPTGARGLPKCTKLPTKAAWDGVGMPKQTHFKTSPRQAAEPWEVFYDQARSAELPALPWFAELAGLSRDTLFRDLGYTFWNRELVAALAARMRGERWLELAAGTGRLTAELARRGVRIAATDDHSQAAHAVRGCQRAIRYGTWVARFSARDALSAFAPEAVLCAWPPLGSCLVPDLLAGVLPESERLGLLVCLGDPAGATEAPVSAHELPPGWTLEAWPECLPWLLGFNDPAESCGSNSRLLVYRRPVPAPD